MKTSVYSVHPGVLMTQKWIGELKQKTGRSLEEWLKFIKKSAPADEKERRARSEERRVGKECRARWSQDHQTKQTGGDGGGGRGGEGGVRAEQDVPQAGGE